MKNLYRENGDGDISEGDSSTSLMRKAWQEKLPEAVRTQIDEDAAYFIHQSLSTPCLNVQAGGSGIYIEDASGNRIIDFHGNSVHHVGHGNPRVFHALIRQARVLAFSVRRYTNEPAIKLAKKLASITPEGISRSLFSPGGTDAIEMAMKLAIGATGRSKFLSFWDSFHGAGFGASSIGGERLFREGMPLLAGTLHVAPPYCYRCSYGHDSPEACNLECARMVRYVLEREGDIAAIVAEAIRSVPYIPPKGYWGIVREACDENGTLLVFDEIPQGLGKTGRMFTFEHFDVIPDIIVAGKALGSGYVPIAAMICRADLNVVKNKAIG
ncbi:aminotransferase class III-fold pyridoxal phosphate-dependent enzyme, partial [Candidatus Bathyarchaeota archaeon]|nr:aminotransferase class III-fold pyridoxal phosphate-dependent enzyme [Candidatus Bathyarchaeota archaeon]